MFFSSVFMLMIVLVVGIIVLSNFSLFLFYIWLSVIIVSVKTNFFVLGGSNKAEIVNNMCCNGVCSFCVRLV